MFFSGAIGSGGSVPSITCCLGTVGGLVVIKSIVEEGLVEVERIVVFFFFCAVLLVLFFAFRGAMASLVEGYTGISQSGSGLSREASEWTAGYEVRVVVCTAGCEP